MRLQDPDSGVVQTVNTVGQSMGLELDEGFVNSLVGDGAMDDGVLTAEELASDPEGQALMAALQEQIAGELGIDPSDVEINDVNVDTSGRRLQAGAQSAKLSGWAFCPTAESCTVDVAYA